MFSASRSMSWDLGDCRYAYDLGEEVQLLRDLTAFQAAFARCEGDDVNGWSDQKEGGLGAVGVVIEVYGVYPDSTVALVGTGGAQFFCPVAAIEEKTGGFDMRFEWARAQYVQGQCVRIVAEPEAFREAFLTTVSMATRMEMTGAQRSKTIWVLRGQSSRRLTTRPLRWHSVTELSLISHMKQLTSTACHWQMGLTLMDPRALHAM